MTAEQLQAETSWFHVFRTMIESGDARKMGSTVFFIYCVVKSHANYSSGEAFPSVETIMEKSGISRPHVMRALKTLEEMDYLRRAKVGRSNRYMLREKVTAFDKVGQPAAVASWDYMPNAVKAAVGELKHFMVTGEFEGAKIVHIEHLHLEIKQMAVGDHASLLQINEAEYRKLPKDLREQLDDIREKIHEREEGKH